MIQKVQQKTQQNIIESLPLCSRCMIHEINSWILDKSGKIDPDATQQVREELKSIRLKPGECLVCRHTTVADGCFENILKVFDKNKVGKAIVEEFKKLFGMAE